MGKFLPLFLSWRRLPVDHHSIIKRGMLPQCDLSGNTRACAIAATKGRPPIDRPADR
jgi:hypothetical protein